MASQEHTPITLNTELSREGIKLTTKDGESAGTIDVQNIDGMLYQFRAPDGTLACARRSRQAAEYDALAWAEEAAAEQGRGS